MDERIDDLTAHRLAGELEAALNEHVGNPAAVDVSVDLLRKVIVHLKTSTITHLRKYAMHMPACPANATYRPGECNCGLSKGAP